MQPHGQIGVRILVELRLPHVVDVLAELEVSPHRLLEPVRAEDLEEMVIRHVHLLEQLALQRIERLVLQRLL